MDKHVSQYWFVGVQRIPVIQGLNSAIKLINRDFFKRYNYNSENNTQITAMVLINSANFMMLFLSLESPTDSSSH